VSKSPNKLEMRAIANAIEQETKKKPPTVTVIGNSGVGKSSALNALFKTSLPVSHSQACTKDFISNDIDLEMTNGAGKGTQVKLRVIDCPGLGEDVSLEDQYLDYYRRHLPEADIVLYLSAARNRAVALEQQHLLALKEFGSRMVFGLSQIDLVEPRNWNERLNCPSEEQQAHIAEICEDRAGRFSSVLERDVKFTPFSANHGYGLQALFTALILSSPEERAWLLDGLKGFDFRSFIPKAARELLVNDLQAKP